MIETRFLKERAELSVQSMRYITEEESLIVLHRVVDVILRASKAGKTIFACGNGGSYSQAEHFIAELVVRFESDRRPIKALTLGCSSSIVSAICNDLDPDEIFSRELEGFGTSGDVLVAFTTSGKSPNIIKCLERASAIGVSCVVITSDRFNNEDMCDISVKVPYSSTAAVQEVHLAMTHLICAELDRLAISNVLID